MGLKSSSRTSFAYTESTPIVSMDGVLGGFRLKNATRSRITQQIPRFHLRLLNYWRITVILR